MFIPVYSDSVPSRHIAMILHCILHIYGIGSVSTTDFKISLPFWAQITI
jgi:hypothetical protein